jgi:hypothetical protein
MNRRKTLGNDKSTFYRFNESRIKHLSVHKDNNEETKQVLNSESKIEKISDELKSEEKTFHENEP